MRVTIYAAKQGNKNSSIVLAHGEKVRPKYCPCHSCSYILGPTCVWVCCIYYEQKAHALHPLIQISKRKAKRVQTEYMYKRLLPDFFFPLFSFPLVVVLFSCHFFSLQSSLLFVIQKQSSALSIVALWYLWYALSFDRRLSASVPWDSWGSIAMGTSQALSRFFVSFTMNSQRSRFCSQQNFWKAEEQCHLQQAFSQ